MAPKPLALICGASSGIGRALSIEAAHRGMDCLLVARSGERLLELKTRIEREAPVMATILQADLSRSEGRSDLLELIRYCELKPDLLVLSAGMLVADSVLAQNASLRGQMHDLHIRACNELIHDLLPVMQKEENGYVLLISSLSALVPLPGFAAYSASKAYQLSLGLALAPELECKGIHLCVCAPGLVDTPLFEHGGLPRPPHGLRAEEVARSALKAVFARRRLLMLPWRSSLRNRFFWLLPEFLQARVLRNLASRITDWQKQTEAHL